MTEAATETLEPPAEKPKRTSSTTKYVVLGKDPDRNAPDWWIEVGRYATRSSKEAIRTHLDKEKVDAGTFVAVPERSFEPVTVKTETVARRTFA